MEKPVSEGYRGPDQSFHYVYQQDYPPIWVNPNQPPSGQHKRTRSWLWTILGVGAVALFVIAGIEVINREDVSLTRSAATAPAGPTASPQTVAPASLPQLKKIVLSAADLPAGWTGTPYKADPNDAAAGADLYTCMGVRGTDGDLVASADSDDFGRGYATISSSATSYRSQRALDADLAMLRSPKVSGCFEQVAKRQFAANLPPGATIISASFTITPGSAGGPANIAATGTGNITLVVKGQEMRLYLNTVFITGPLIEAEVDADSLGTPVPDSLVQSLAAVVATRAANR